MPTQVRIIRRMPSVFDSPSAFALARNASHSGSSMRPPVLLTVLLDGTESDG
jgi:hypothetical protein